MQTRKKLVIAVSVLLTVLLIVGVSTLAATNYGTKTDPLVTLSYIDQTVTKSINSALDSAIETAKTSLTADFDAKIEAFTKALEGQTGGSGSGGTADTFVLVTLTNGQTLTCPVGSELLLRIGTAVTYGPNSPRLVDETDGASISAAGTALTTNHMYLVTIANNGVKATSATVKILVRGAYTIK